jgi:hypothetical protein
VVEEKENNSFVARGSRWCVRLSSCDVSRNRTCAEEKTIGGRKEGFGLRDLFVLRIILYYSIIFLFYSRLVKLVDVVDSAQ